MNDVITEVTTESWFSRIRNAFGGIVVGLVLFIGAFPALTWNEKRFIDRTRGLKEVAGQTISVDGKTLDAAADGKAIHFSAEATTKQGVKDDTFGIAEPALKLRRTVEMYQWEEEKKSKTEEKVGGSSTTTTTYTYRKEWSSGVNDSSDFKKPEGHENPTEMMFPSDSFAAPDVTAGAFRLPASLVSGIGGWEDYPAPAVEALPESIRAKAKATGTSLYFGENPAQPVVGDHRVEFEVVRPHEVTIVARQVRDTLEPVPAGNTKVELIEDGVHSAEAMFQMAHEENRFLTWILRLVFAFLMGIGLSLIFHPLKVLASVIPLAGSLVGAGTGLVAFLLAAALSSATIALAWLAFRPLIGVPLLVVTVGLFVVVGRRMKRASQVA
ncbi:MAG: Protein of unknown function DUF1625 [Verrucomicrobia bacterium]|jgi:hypothetical protein|nr:MAG: Protein of unknown function DUF1625 [Verrucomicrobiota bacterium]